MPAFSGVFSKSLLDESVCTKPYELVTRRSTLSIEGNSLPFEERPSPIRQLYSSFAGHIFSFFITFLHLPDDWKLTQLEETVVCRLVENDPPWNKYRRRAWPYRLLIQNAESWFKSSMSKSSQYRIEAPVSHGVRRIEKTGTNYATWYSMNEWIIGERKFDTMKNSVLVRVFVPTIDSIPQLLYNTWK